MPVFLSCHGLYEEHVFQCREDVHEARLLSPLHENGLDPVFFPKLFPFSDKLDFEAMLLRYRLGIGPDAVPERLSKPGIIEDADALEMQKRRHAGCITETQQCALNDALVKTGEHSTDFIVVSFRQ